MWTGLVPVPEATEAVPTRLLSGQLDLAASAVPLLAAAAGSAAGGQYVTPASLALRPGGRSTLAPFSSWLPSERTMSTLNEV